MRSVGSRAHVRVREGIGFALAVCIGACTSSGPDAAGPDAAGLDAARGLDGALPDSARDVWAWTGEGWLYDVPGPDAPQPTDRAPPVVNCGFDAGWTLDPCAEARICADGWASVYTGTCGADGRCSFPDPPVWDYCELGCHWSEPEARCTRPGPTAP